jgi:uncharacterized protein (TIGR02246 family)
MKHNHFSLFIYVLPALLCLSCNNKQKEQHDFDQLNVTIAQLDNAWNNLDVEKIVGLFAEDGTLLNDQSEMLRGRDAIRKSFEMSKPEKLEFKRDKVEVKMDGNFAYEIVNQVVTIKNKDEESKTFLNKYIHIWKKQNDGSWRVLIDMNNMRTPPSE